MGSTWGHVRWWGTHKTVAGTASAAVAMVASTLLLHVPVSLGSAHQAGALMLMTLGGALLHSLRVAPGVRRQLLAGAARAAKGGA